MEFIITVTETLKRTIIAEAESSEEALAMVREAYNEGSIVLDSGDYYNTVEFKDETKKYPKRERGKLPTLDKYTKKPKGANESDKGNDNGRVGAGTVRKGSARRGN